MHIKNIKKDARDRQRAALPSTLTEEDLGRAMAQLDLSSVPPEKRGYAIRAHLLTVAAGSLENRALGSAIYNARLAALIDHAKERGLA